MSNRLNINGEPEARIAVAKCKEAKGKTYGVRFQRSDDGWKYNWAFEIKEKAAAREGYSKTEIDGMISPDDKYPGCPYCKTKYFVICGSCKHLNCNVATPGPFTCEWCGFEGELTGFGGDGIAAGGDRG